MSDNEEFRDRFPEQAERAEAASARAREERAAAARLVEELTERLAATRAALEPLAKQLMVEAVTAAASHDGRISVAESELLRTICGVLHCPLPPGLEQA